jgi:hypothetical protein
MERGDTPAIRGGGVSPLIAAAERVKPRRASSASPAAAG